MLNTLGIYGGRGFLPPREFQVTIFRGLASHRTNLLEILGVRRRCFVARWVHSTAPTTAPDVPKPLFVAHSAASKQKWQPLTLKLAPVPLFTSPNGVATFPSHLNYIIIRTPKTPPKHVKHARNLWGKGFFGPTRISSNNIPESGQSPD